MTKDYYAVLGVSPEATTEEIQVAFEKLSARWGQDVRQEEQWAEVEEAYGVLSDPRARAEYHKLYKMLGPLQQNYDGLDAVKHGARAVKGWWQTEEFPQTAAEGTGSVYLAKWGAGEDTEQINDLDWELNLDDLDYPAVNDLIVALKNAVLNLLNGQGHVWQEGLGQHRDDAHIYLDLRLHPREVKPRAYKFLDYHCYTRCLECGGKGSREGKPLVDCLACASLKTKPSCLVCAGLGKYPEENCLRCKGEGRVMAHRQVEVRIPADVEHNSIIHVAGAGHRGFRGQKNGDLFIKVLLAKGQKR